MRPFTNASIGFRHWFVCLICALACTAFAQEDRGALITALEGKATLVKGIEKRPLAPFERLEAGDVVSLEQGKLTIVFFLTGRQETWQGTGKLEVGPGEGKGSGLPAPEAKTLAPFLVKQIARTPTLLAQGRAGVMRLRAIATPEAIAKVEETYKRLRMETPAEDLAPEMYRLSALFDMKAFEALDVAVKELEVSRPNHNEAKLLANLYRKALKNVQEAR
ncbi:MAG: hypothetical protein N3C63_10210 [Rhodocyclaceae bacterium]|nr:hypothetical protein [Rhodocyclaceae bacterium]